MNVDKKLVDFMNQQKSGKQFAILQLKDGRENVTKKRFLSLATLTKLGFVVDAEDYKFVYSGCLDRIDENTLESLFARFNIAIPHDFMGHSLSVSDVIVLRDNGKNKFYYVNSIGFAELPDFVKEDA